MLLVPLQLVLCYQVRAQLPSWQWCHSGENIDVSESVGYWCWCLHKGSASSRCPEAPQSVWEHIVSQWRVPLSWCSQSKRQPCGSIWMYLLDCRRVAALDDVIQWCQLWEKKETLTVNLTVHLNLFCLDIIFPFRHLSPECDALLHLNDRQGKHGNEESIFNSKMW